MSNSLVKRDLTADLESIRSFATEVVLAGLLGKVESDVDKRLKIATAIVKAQAGAELGLGPWSSQTAFHLIDGKLSPSANLMATLIKQSKEYDYTTIISDDKECVLEFWKKNVSLGRVSFTLEEAKKAKLTSKVNWGNYAQDLLFARTLTRGFRRYCPHLTSGMALYATEEMPDGEETHSPVTKGESPLPKYHDDDIIEAEFYEPLTVDNLKAQAHRQGAVWSSILSANRVVEATATQEQLAAIKTILDLNETNMATGG